MSILRCKRMLAAIVLVGCSHVTSTYADAPASTNLNQDTFKEQRQIYLKAAKAWDDKRLTEYHSLTKKIPNYPLIPYLEYQELVGRLYQLPYAEVDQFGIRYPDSFLAERLTHRWLRVLAQREQWKDYLTYYDKRLSDPELQCFHVNARLKTGDKTALSDVAPLWNIEKAQVKACDEPFAQWRQAGMMTSDLIWSRHLKAVKAGNKGLASYLSNLLRESERTQALLLQQVDQSPNLLKQTTKFAAKGERMSHIVAHGIEKLARTSAKEALNHYSVYSAKKRFSVQEKNHLEHQLVLRLLYQDMDGEASRIARANTSLNQVDILEWILRNELQKQNWEAVRYWISRLPDAAQQQERWRYWAARSALALSKPLPDGRGADSEFIALANERSFYGFLSADRVGKPYQLLDKPKDIAPVVIQKVATAPGILRAKEFFIRKEFAAAAREFFFTTKYLSGDEKVVAALIADQWGWHRIAIQTIAEAQYWDDLRVRFPTEHKDAIFKTAKETGMDPLLLFAVTRQESAFAVDAKSSAGAVGLMQLLPSTAAQVAQKNGIKFAANDLIDPAKNVALGARYLKYLMGSFDSNRMLMASAYNAGPSRARRWQSPSEALLPSDVWVEVIPFRETRGYVQNILTYSVIYGYRLGIPTTLFTEAERQKGI
jgi:soluble lytic murein transglycosylase